jgi:6,7-dimethyl-8-ribityllumazine synthase
MAEFIAAARGEGRRVAVIASRFNEEVVRKLVDGAMNTLVERGTSFDDIDVIWVPGAWELPVTARFLLEKERYDVLITLGAVIQGETKHFDYIAGECARALQQLSIDFAMPISFGVLTTLDDAQAEARAGGAHGTKGSDAALAALEMAELFDRFDASCGSDGDDEET